MFPKIRSVDGIRVGYSSAEISGIDGIAMVSELDETTTVRDGISVDVWYRCAIGTSTSSVFLLLVVFSARGLEAVL